MSIYPNLSLSLSRIGLCDEKLIDVTNRHSLFRQQARYLVQRQSPELWAKVIDSLRIILSSSSPSSSYLHHLHLWQVLDPQNPLRQNLVDQVTQTVLPDSQNAEEVSATVKVRWRIGEESVGSMDP